MKFVNKYIKKSFKMGKMHLIIVLKWMNEREKGNMVLSPRDDIFSAS